jgi:proteasome component ECM29
VKLNDDSRLFEAGQLGSAPGGGSLTTYKELCSLATELGQPDLGETYTACTAATE